MTKGNLAIVLHAHLPYVRSKNPGSLEEDWFFQALIESYLPLLKTIETSEKELDEAPKITIGLSPTLLSLLEDSELKKRFPKWVETRLEILKTTRTYPHDAVENLLRHFQTHLESWNSCNGDLIKRFSKLKENEVIDILTCAATHGYLPLLRENPEAVRAQLKTAVREHSRLFNGPPLGIWLPECAYYEDLDILMIEAGLRYAVLDGHGLLNADPRPRYGLYAPICSKNGVAFFGRDSQSTLPVWSAKDGYPGNPEYREFHRDIGWDLSTEALKELGFYTPRPLGLKLNKVTSSQTPLKDKGNYDPKSATLNARADAKDYIDGRKKQLENLKNFLTISPLLIAPFDAELFGHWWFEGPTFLAEIFKLSKNNVIKLVRLKDMLIENPKIQLCQPCPSSWGQGGFHNYWVNESNAWIVSEWSKSARKMVEFATKGVKTEFQIRILQQAGRELLLSQSSDWSFILRAGTTTELAKGRINLHLKRFWTLMNSITDNNNELSEDELIEIEKEDCIFPLIQASDWIKIND